MKTYIEQRLTEWSLFCLRQKDQSFGYPGQSPIVRFGTVSSKVFDATLLWSTSESDVSDVAKAVEDLRPEEKIIVAAYYLKCGESKSKAAKMLQMPRQTFVDRLCVVHVRVECLLNKHQEKPKMFAAA